MRAQTPLRNFELFWRFVALPATAAVLGEMIVGPLL